MKLKSAMSSIALCLAATALLSAAELKEFGILGQSQPEGAEVLREPFCGSAVNDPQGNVWFVNGNGVYRIAGGERTAIRVLQSAGRLMTDGEEIFLQRNTVLLRLQTGPDGRVNTRQALDFRKGFTCTGVAHAATKKGFGEKLKYFALDGTEKKVYGWNAKGEALGVVLDLSGFRTTGKVVSAGFMPGSGYLLVSTMYPDSRVYRFDTDGRTVGGGIWPAGGWMNHFSFVNGQVWGCGDRAVRYEDSLSEGKVVSLGDGMDNYARALAGDGGSGYYLATSQGLKHYAAGNLKKCDFRIGGIGTPAALAVLNGKIIAVSGWKILGLNLDDFPDSPFGSTGNEPWHVGGNWVSDGVAAVSDGTAFLILDAKLGKLWRFDPSKTRWGDRSRMVDLKRSFKKPSDLACVGGTLLIVDNGTLNVANDLTLPVRRVDAFSPEEIVAAGEGWIALLNNGKTVWKKEMPVRDVAVIGEFIAVAGPELLLLTKKGGIVSRAPYRLQTLAVDGKWLLGADHAKAALRKFKLVGEK